MAQNDCNLGNFRGSGDVEFNRREDVGLLRDEGNEDQENFGLRAREIEKWQRMFPMMSSGRLFGSNYVAAVWNDPLYDRTTGWALRESV